MTTQSHSKAVGHTPIRFPDRISVKEGALTVSHVDAEFGSEDEPTVTALFSVPKAHYGVMCEMAERYNSHDDLVEALRELLEVASVVANSLPPCQCYGPSITPAENLCSRHRVQVKFAKAEAALAKAKGEK